MQRLLECCLAVTNNERDILLSLAYVWGIRKEYHLGKGKDLTLQKPYHMKLE